MCSPVHGTYKTANIVSGDRNQESSNLYGSRRDWVEAPGSLLGGWNCSEFYERVLDARAHTHTQDISTFLCLYVSYLNKKVFFKEGMNSRKVLKIKVRFLHIWMRKLTGKEGFRGSRRGDSTGGNVWPGNGWELPDIQDTVPLRQWEGPWVEMSSKGVDTQVQGWVHSWRRRLWRHQGAVMSLIQKRKKCRPSGNLSRDGQQRRATFTQREPGFLFFLPLSVPSWTLFSFVPNYQSPHFWEVSLEWHPKQCPLTQASNCPYRYCQFVVNFLHSKWTKTVWMKLKVKKKKKSY